MVKKGALVEYTLSATNPKQAGPGWNLGFRGERPATSSISHGTACSKLEIHVENM